jgi:hypothetical protein
MRPLSVKTIIPCRTDRSILKVIVCCLAQAAMALLHCCHRGCRLTKVQRGGHRQTTEIKGVEGKLDDETSGSAGFSGVKKEWRLALRDKLVLLDVQLLNLRVQRRAGNSEFCCRTFWARNFPFRFC